MSSLGLTTKEPVGLQELARTLGGGLRGGQNEKLTTVKMTLPTSTVLAGTCIVGAEDGIPTTTKQMKLPGDPVQNGPGTTEVERTLTLGIATMMFTMLTSEE